MHKDVPRPTVLLIALLCSGCYRFGLAEPTDHIWHIALDRPPGKETIQSYIASHLPASRAAFQQFLETEHFHCAAADDTATIGCDYHERGPSNFGSTCVGWDLSLRVKFDNADPVRSFDLHRDGFEDKDAHGSGICAPL
jgi:hypothetical protein